MDTNLKQIPQKAHDAVFGFIKQQSQNKICSKLPTELINIILMFYHIFEEWDKNAIGEFVTINGNIVEHTGSHNKHQSAYLTNVVSSGINIWKFEATKRTFTWDLIGIWKTKSGEPSISRWFTDKMNNGYAYVIGDPRKTDPTNPGYSGGRYGIQCNDGDIIEMELNFNKLSLCFKVNGINQGKAFDVEDTSYRAAVSFYSVGEKYTFISYTQK